MLTGHPCASDAAVASIFGGLFLFFAAAAGFEEHASLEMFWMYVAACVCAIVFLFATLSLIRTLNTYLGGGGGPGAGKIPENLTTPCDARG